MPGIEEVIQTTLHGDTRANALDFIAFLHQNDIPFHVHDTYLDVYLEGKNVCSVLITGTDEAPGPWTIWSDQEPGSWITWAEDGSLPPDDDAFPVDAHTKAVLWAHVNPCASCGGDCAPGKAKRVLGKRFDGLCSSAIAFRDPDAEALACAKQMVLQRKRDILYATS